MQAGSSARGAAGRREGHAAACWRARKLAAFRWFYTLTSQCFYRCGLFERLSSRFLKELSSAVSSQTRRDCRKRANPGPADPDTHPLARLHHALYSLRVSRSRSEHGGCAEATSGGDAEDAVHPAAALECARCTATAAATRLVHHARSEHRPDLLLRWKRTVPVGPASG